MPVPNNLSAIQKALEDGGVEFIEGTRGICGEGVRWKWREDTDDETETPGAPDAGAGQHAALAGDETTEDIEGDPEG